MGSYIMKQQGISHHQDEGSSYLFINLMFLFVLLFLGFSGSNFCIVIVQNAWSTCRNETKERILTL